MENGGITFGRSNDERGYTLIEILIAIFILTFGLFGIISLITTSMDKNRFTNTKSSALNLAQLQMEMLINASYDNPNISDTNAANNGSLTSTTSYDYKNTDIDGNPINPAVWGDYELILNVADDTPITDTKTIVVIVTQGNQKKQELCQIKARAGSS